MVRNRTIQIRITREQYERIKNYSRVKGFNSLSSYLRFVALEQDLVLQHKIREIHEHLLGSQSSKKFRKNGLAYP